MKKNSAEQLNLFALVKKAQELSMGSQQASPGSLDIDAEFRAAVTADLKACPLSRYEVAARMSELTGQEITESMLYSWTADSKEKHRFPCQFLPVFVIATGGQRRAVEVISRHSGLFLLPGPEALRAEIQRLDEEEKKIKNEKQKRKVFLSEIEGKNR